MSSSGEGLLTLEPLIEALREGIEATGWELSGLQKTTSQQFEGRWEGESTRSAYLFFHPTEGPDFVSVDVYLDETGRGLTGNVALVADLVALRDLGAVEGALESLRVVSNRELDPVNQRPLTLRFRMRDVAGRPSEAETEVRFKVRLPRSTIALGSGAVTAWVGEVMRGFARILLSTELDAIALPPDADEDAVT